MKADANTVSELYKKFKDYFKADPLEYRSLHDLLWQIAVNRVLEDEKDPIIFHPNVTARGNEMVLAYASGGYKSTGVFFTSDNWSDCHDVATEINSLFFQIDDMEQRKIMVKSMA